MLVDRVMTTFRAFFDLPEVEKMAIENLKSPYFRGYTRVGIELTQGRVVGTSRSTSDRNARPSTPE